MKHEELQDFLSKLRHNESAIIASDEVNGCVRTSPTVKRRFLIQTYDINRNLYNFLFQRLTEAHRKQIELENKNNQQEELTKLQAEN